MKVLTTARPQTVQWFEARCGKITASPFWQVMAFSKRDLQKGVRSPLEARQKYVADLVCERLTGIPVDHVTTRAMQWGVDTEDEALTAYELRIAPVEYLGVIGHPTLDFAACTPDSGVGDDGLVQVKCPETHTHIRTITTGEFDEKYMIQVQWEMACTGRAWCELVSYDPRLPEKMQMYRKRVLRDNEKIAEMEREAVLFNDEVNGAIEALREMSEHLGVA